MIAQELLSLVQQLSFVFRTGAEITPPQLLQDLVPCCLTHALIHFRHANSHFWHNVSIPLSLPPSSGNKTFGAMRSHQGAPISIDGKEPKEDKRQYCVAVTMNRIKLAHLLPMLFCWVQLCIEADNLSPE